MQDSKEKKGGKKAKGLFKVGEVSWGLHLEIVEVTGVDKEFQSLDKQFQSLDKELQSLGKGFQTLGKELQSLDKKFKRLDKGFLSLDKEFQSLTVEGMKDWILPNSEVRVAAELFIRLL